MKISRVCLSRLAVISFIPIIIGADEGTRGSGELGGSPESTLSMYSGSCPEAPKGIRIRGLARVPPSRNPC